MSLASIIQLLPWEAAAEEHDPGTIKARNETCSTSVRFADACLIVIMTAYTGFAALRMSALYNMSISVFATVLSIGLVNPCTQIFLMFTEATTANLNVANPGGFALHQWINCNHRMIPRIGVLLGSGVHRVPSIGYVFVMLRAHALIFEVVLISLTWRRAATRWCHSEGVCASTPLTAIFFRDGTLYFIMVAVATILNLTSMAFSLSSCPGLGLAALASGGPIVDAITSICMSRFFLRLVAATFENRNASQPTLHYSPMRFAKSIAGDFGAPLGVAEVREERSEYEEEQGMDE